MVFIIDTMFHNAFYTGYTALAQWRLPLQGFCGKVMILFFMKVHKLSAEEQRMLGFKQDCVFFCIGFKRVRVSLWYRFRRKSWLIGFGVEITFSYRIFYARDNRMHDYAETEIDCYTGRYRPGRENDWNAGLFLPECQNVALELAPCILTRVKHDCVIVSFKGMIE